MTDGTYEDVTQYDLDADDEEQLLLGHNECTFIWANKEGWPVGVIMSYSQEIKQWFYPELAAALRPDEESARQFALFLDSPRRLVMEVEPTQRIGYDGAKMGKATAEWMANNT